MKIETPSSTFGIRGTSGVVEVPEGATPGSAGEVAVKLYADQDGRVGRIELFGAGGGPRLGLLTRAATGFSLRGGRGRTLHRRGADDLAAAGGARPRLRAARVRGAQHRPADDQPAAQSALAGPAAAAGLACNRAYGSQAAQQLRPNNLPRSGNPGLHAPTANRSDLAESKPAASEAQAGPAAAARGESPNERPPR